MLDFVAICFARMPTSSESRSVARFGVFAADLSARRLYKHGIEIRLQEQPFQVLALLLDRPSELISREELRQQLWPTDTFVAFDEGLNNAVNRLRRALGDTADNPRFIETIPRQGYRFIAPVAEPEPKTEEVASAPVEEVPGPAYRAPTRKARVRLAVAALAAVVLAASGVYFLRLQQNAVVNPQAIQEYQQGRELWRLRTPETLAKAIDHFNKSVALNPSYAPAYSGLADAYLVLPFLSSVSQEEAYPKAREAVTKASALDPWLAEAHTSAADVKLYADWDFAGAEKEFRRAIELNPNYATAYQWYAEYLSLMGRHGEAIQEIQRAQKLEPLSLIMYHQAGQIYQNARQYDKAIEQYSRALEISPGFTPSAGRLTDALRHKGLFSEALETEKELLKHGSFYDPGGAPAIAVEERTQGYKIRGLEGYWNARLKENQRAPNSTRVNYQTAVVYAQLRDPDNAFLCLEKAYEGHYSDILSLKVDPDLDPLRSDPRFQELVRRVGLP
jgi:DNA-binding winged helix-turn-helix (wHTH) protein